MLDLLQTFLTFAEQGTMTRAALTLHTTQSAVSKRIKALEEGLGQSLVEKSGRKLKLTARGRHIVQNVSPLLVELKNTMQQELLHGQRAVSLSVSSAIIISWGPRILAAVERTCPNLKFNIATFSSTVSVERVRSGDYMLALCHGTGFSAPDLVVEKLAEERMVIVPSGLKPFKIKPDQTISLIGPEPHSESWSALSPQLEQAKRRWGFTFKLEQHLVSFAGVTQLALAGFGHGLVPLSVALALGVPQKKLYHFCNPKLTLPINLLGRKSLLNSEDLREMIKLLKVNLQKELA